MNKKILTVTLNPAIDRFLEINNFKAGEDFRADDLAVCAGGKGINVARSLKALGIDAMSIGITAGGSGKAIRSLLKREGLDLKYVEASGESRVNFTIVDNKNKCVTRLLGRGPKADRRLEKEFLELYRKFLSGSDWVVISGRGLEGSTDLFYRELLNMAGKRKINVAIDACPGMFTVLQKIRFKPAVIKFNESEWKDFSGQRFSKDSFLKHAKRLCSSGISVVLITRAEKGAIGYNGKTCVEVSSRKVSSLFDVGCGDAFLAGFLAAVIKGRDLSGQLRWASACAAASLRDIVPGRIRLSWVREEYLSVKERELL